MPDQSFQERIAAKLDEFADQQGAYVSFPPISAHAASLEDFMRAVRCASRVEGLRSAAALVRGMKDV